MNLYEIATIHYHNNEKFICNIHINLDNINTIIDNPINMNGIINMVDGTTIYVDRDDLHKMIMAKE
jgi:hypothetical protein